MSIVTYYSLCDSPVGEILLTGSEKGLTGLYIKTGIKTVSVPQNAVRNDAVLEDTVRQLTAYFAGSLREFTVNFDLAGTEFQKKVWQELYKIPYGTVISYKELAQRVGSPKAVRAVGSANGKNPISIIIPCHRVIGADGGLGGYGWGLTTKKQLLYLEKAL
jgi:methylated-DNA-[protein]-cysteine S-methyltransferase